MIAKLINGFVAIFIGVTLLPLFAEPINLIGWTIIEEKKPHKQTYLEYVKERLEVEKLMKL